MSSTRDISGEGKVICVWDLPSGLLSRKAIKNHFSKYGIVTQVVLNEDNGTCQVSFSTHDDAQYALTSGNMWNDKNLQIFWMQSSYLDPRSTEINLPQFEEDILWENDDKECFGIEKNKNNNESRRKSSKEIIRRHLKASISPQKNYSDVTKKSKEMWQTALTVKKDKEYSTTLDKLKVIEKQRKVKISDKELTKKKISLGKFKKEKVAVSRATKTKNLQSDSEGNISENLPLLERTATTLKEKFAILEERDRLIRSMLKEVAVNKVRMKGTCPDMCPEKERVMRNFRHLVSVYETSSETNEMIEELAIKEYSRSSADQEEPLSHELRPGPVLTMTMIYIIRNIMERIENADENMAEWYDFCWDRLRGIRKDITQQQLCDVQTVTIVEQCARFHICCYDRLWGTDASVFDEKINTENLMNCLQSLTHMYEDLDKQNITCSNEAEFKSYKILLKLDSSDVMWEYQQFSPILQLSVPVQFAVKIHAAFHSKLYARFFNLVKKTTYLNACLLQRYFNKVRTQALDSIIKAYTMQTVKTSIPLKFIVSVLKFDFEEDAIVFCESHGICLEVNKTEFRLSRKSFSNPETLVKTKLSSGLVKNKHLPISQAVVGESQPVPVCVPYKVHSSFDEQGRLHSSALDASDQAHTVSLLYKTGESHTFETGTVKPESKKFERERVFRFTLPERPRSSENIIKLQANGNRALVAVPSTTVQNILSKSLPMPMASVSVLETSDTGSVFNKNFQMPFIDFQQTLMSSDSKLSRDMECTQEEVDVLNGRNINNDTQENVSFVSVTHEEKYGESSIRSLSETSVTSVVNESWRFSFITDSQEDEIKKNMKGPIMNTRFSFDEKGDTIQTGDTNYKKCSNLVATNKTDEKATTSAAEVRSILPFQDSQEQKIKQQSIELKEFKTQEEQEYSEIRKQKWGTKLLKIQENQKWETDIKGRKEKEKEKHETELKKIQEKIKLKAEMKNRQEIEKRKTLQALKKDLRQRLKIMNARICARRWKEKVERIKKSKVDFPVLVEMSVKDHLEMWGTVGNRSEIKPSRVLQRLQKRNRSNIVVSKLIRFGLKNSVVYLGDKLAEMLVEHYVSNCKKRTDIKSIYWKLVISIPHGVSEETEIFNKQIKNWCKCSLYKDGHASFGSVQCTETSLKINVYTCIQILEKSLDKNYQKQICHGMDSVLFIYVDGWEGEEETLERISDIVHFNSQSTFSLTFINVGEHTVPDRIKSTVANEDNINNWVIQEWVGPESIQKGLTHLVHNINIKPNICTAPLKFLLLDVCDEFFDALSAGQYSSHQLAAAVKTPNNIIRLFNICISKLEDMLISKKLEKCSLFGKEFKPFIPTSEIPGGLEKFCGYSYDDTYKNSISKILKSVKLPEFHKWPPKSSNRLLKVLKEYCLKLHNVSILPNIIRMINPQEENRLIEHLDNISWISFVELWAKECIIYNCTILETKTKTKNFVIYDKTDIRNLTMQKWWLKTQIVCNYRCLI